MYYVTEKELHATAEETGDGSKKHGPWVPTSELLEGSLWVDVQAIDGETTLALELEYANKDKTIVGVAPALAITNMTAVSQQGPIRLSQFAAFARINHTITNGKKATFRAVLDGRGLGT